MLVGDLEFTLEFIEFWFEAAHKLPIFFRVIEMGSMAELMNEKVSDKIFR